MELLFYIGVLISAFMSIIMFFVIWIMAGNVQSILNKMEEKDELSVLVTGDEKSAAALLVRKFTDEIRGYIDMASGGNMTREDAQKRIDEIASAYSGKAKSLDVSFDFEKAGKSIFARLDVMKKR